LLVVGVGFGAGRLPNRAAFSREGIVANPNGPKRPSPFLPIFSDLGLSTYPWGGPHRRRATGAHADCRRDDRWHAPSGEGPCRLRTGFIGSDRVKFGVLRDPIREMGISAVRCEANVRMEHE